MCDKKFLGEEILTVFLLISCTLFLLIFLSSLPLKKKVMLRKAYIL